MGGATAHIYIPMGLLGVVEQTEKYLLCLKLLSLIREDNYWSLLTFIVLLVIRLWTVCDTECVTRVVHI